MALIVSVVAVCVLLLVLAFLFPRLSSRPQRGVNSALEAGRSGSGHAPGRLGPWLQKPFSKSERATNKSASAGRRGRSRLPF
jgi:hypothetical protein